MASLLVTAASAGMALAQDLGTLHPQPLPALAHPDDPATPAKELFARALKPAPLAPDAIGFYARGCLAGGQRPCRSPATPGRSCACRATATGAIPCSIDFLERLARKVRADGIFPGLLIGDIAQPRGGPMINGHASHQVGLDADIWLRPMPDALLTPPEREEMLSTNVVRRDRLDVDRQKWTPQHMALIKETAEQPRSAAHLRQSGDQEGDLPRCHRRPLMARQGPADVRPRLSFPRPHRLPGGGSGLPDAGVPPPPGDGCDASLAWWFSDAVLHPKPNRQRQTAKADHDGATAGGLPQGARREIGVRRLIQT